MKNLQELVHKLDRHILPFLSLLYLLSYLDRVNISAVHDVFLEELGLTDPQFSLAVSVFYIGYIIFEIPCNLILKRVNPSYWLGSLVAAWGICAVCMIFVTDFTSLVLVRTFLGIAESGFFPGVVYYLSRWYRPHELSFRIALFYCSSALAGVISGLLAYGFLQIEEFGGLSGWQLLFLCEGAPSVILGFMTYYVLPSSPSKVSWLNEDEKLVLDNKLQSISTLDDLSVSQSTQVWQVLTSPKVWAFAIMFLGIVTPAYATSFYTPAIIAKMGYSTLDSNLLSSPISLFSFVCIIFNGWHADKTKERGWHFIIPCTVGCLGFLSLSISTYFEEHGVSYGSMYFVTAGTATCIPIVLSWLTNSLQGSTQIATATALVVAVGNIGGILGPNLYGFLYIEGENGEEGTYYVPHFVNTGILFFTILLAFVIKFSVKQNAPYSDSETDPLIQGDKKTPSYLHSVIQ